MSILTENRHTWYFGGVNSKSGLRFLKFRPQIHFWANLDPKTQSCSFCLKIGAYGISRMLILITTLFFWISNPNFLSGQIWTEKVKIGTHAISEVQIPNPDLDFWNSDPKIHFWANLSRKSKSCSVWLEIGTQSVSTILILIPTLFFSVSNPKSFFGQIWIEKFKVVYFDWKLAHMVYRGCSYLFQQ